MSEARRPQNPRDRSSQATDKSYSERLEKLLFAVTDYTNAIEAAAVALRQNIKELAEIPEKKPAEVYDQLPWQDREGSKGPFQMVNKRLSGNSDLYRHLYNIVKANTVNTGKFAHKIGEWLYWMDTRDTPTDPTAIYRRRKKKAESAKEGAEAQTNVENVKQRFPEDLAVLLTFEEAAEAVIIRPRQYLGSENFARILSIVREAGGEYVSQGKQSHFRIPVKK